VESKQVQVFKIKHLTRQIGTEWQCDNYNLKSQRQCSNISRINLSGYV